VRQTKYFVYKVRDGIGWLNLTSADGRNVFDSNSIPLFEATFESAYSDPNVGAIVIISRGKIFSTGADISEIAQFTRESGESMSKRGHDLMNFIGYSPKPVIAAVNGYAFGVGIELAMACSLRIASDKARFCFPELKLGLIPAFGGTQRLARIVGKGRALDMMLTGRIISADEAFQMGLVNRVCGDLELEKTAEALAKRIIRNDAETISMILDAVNKGADLTPEEGFKLEAKLFGKACETKEKTDKTNSFLVRRKNNINQNGI